MVELEFIKSISEGNIYDGTEFIGAVETERIEFKPKVKGTLEKDMSSMANMNHISYYILGMVSKGGGKNDYIKGFQNVKTEMADTEAKIHQLINPPPFWITPFFVSHDEITYQQYKIEIWPSKDICGVPGKAAEDGFIQINHYGRYESKTFLLLRAQSNKIIEEKKIFVDAAKFYELLDFKISYNKNKIGVQNIDGCLQRYGLFDYPEIELDTIKAISSVARIQQIDFAPIENTINRYRHELNKLKFFHMEYLHHRWSGRMKDLHKSGGINFSKVRQEVKDSAFITDNLPSQLLTSISFLKPYKSKWG